MRKKILTYTLILSFSIYSSPSLVHADSAVNEATMEETIDPSNMTSTSPSTPDEVAPTTTEEDDENPVGSPVAPADSTNQKKGNRQFWTNLIIAGVAVVVAVVSILVVSNNNGKK